MKIWQRYFLKETLKNQLFFLLGLYLVYVIVDFSTHGVRFLTYDRPEVYELFLYYWNDFIKYFYLFLPLTFMLATLKVLCDMNIHNELVALQMAGNSVRTLMRPFFLIAFFLCTITLLNFEYFVPSSLSYVEDFRIAHSKNRDKKLKPKKVNILSLKDHSKLVYQAYDTEKKELFDVFWIRSSDDIWHFKSLILTTPPQATYVEQIQKNEEGLYEKTQTFEKYTFKEIKLEEQEPELLPIDHRPITQLLSQYRTQNYSSDRERAMILTNLNFKLAIPLLSFLVLFACTPFAVRFSRKAPIFFIFTLSLFGFVAFYTIMDSAVVLGENMALSPLWAVWAPFLLGFSLFGWNFSKI